MPEPPCFFHLPSPAFLPALSGIHTHGRAPLYDPNLFGPARPLDALENDASPPCSGHGGLTPGLGDREVKAAHAARGLAWAVGTARSVPRTKINDPSRGHPESPSPPASRLAPDMVHCGPSGARVRRVLTLCGPCSCLPDAVVAPRPAQSVRFASVLVRRSYVKGVLSAPVRRRTTAVGRLTADHGPKHVVGGSGDRAKAQEPRIKVSG
jgi:hypothetical protein